MLQFLEFEEHLTDLTLFHLFVLDGKNIKSAFPFFKKKVGELFTGFRAEYITLADRSH